MPDFTTHHIFGQQLLDAMPAAIRKAAEAEPSAYFWGLQGPDLLFFHRAVWDKSPLPNLGRRLHAEKTGLLFSTLLGEVIDRRKMADFPVLEAYFLGFICHYILDREIHPYVFCRQREMAGPNPADNSAHWKIEAAIDRELYHLLYEKSIRCFPLSAHYGTGRETRAAISGLYRRILHRVYGFAAAQKSIGECFKDAIWINRLLYDRSGVLKPVAAFAQNFLKKGELFTDHIKPGPLDGDFLNLAKKPWRNLDEPEKEENASVPEMMARAVGDAAGLQDMAFRAVRKGDRQGLKAYDFSRSFVYGKGRD